MVLEAALRVVELLGRLVLEGLELPHEEVVVAREHEVERLHAEAHRLLLAGAAADALAQLALEEEAREALAGLADLALDGGVSSPARKRRASIFLRLAMSSISICARSGGAAGRSATCTPAAFWSAWSSATTDAVTASSSGLVSRSAL